MINQISVGNWKYPKQNGTQSVVSEKALRGGAVATYARYRTVPVEQRSVSRGEQELQMRGKPFKIFREYHRYYANAILQ